MFLHMNDLILFFLVYCPSVVNYKVIGNVSLDFKLRMIIICYLNSHCRLLFPYVYN